MKADRFTLPKKTGTYADALGAMGLGRLLRLLSGESPIIQDEGAVYEVTWLGGARELTDLDYDAVHDAPGYKYVLLKAPDNAAPSSEAAIDYAQERERLRAYRERRDALAKAHGGRATPEAEEELKQIEPMKGWYLYQNLNVLQAYGSYNALHAEIRTSDRATFAASVCAKLEALANGDDPALVSTAFAPKLSVVQAFNPSVGKGTNRPKPDGPSLASLPSAFVDWFEEWLRYVGVHLAANALKVGDDLKLFVMAPASLNAAEAEGIRDDFVSLRLPWSPAKIDILGALGLVGVLIRRSSLLDSAPNSLLHDLFPDTVRRTPRDVIAGLQTAYFTSLGSAFALTNTAFIGLPGWFPVNSQTADDWLSILAEHENVIKALDEEHSEEAALLGAYRNFLSAGEQGIAALLTFLARYAAYIVRAQDRQRYAPPFTTAHLRRLFVNVSIGTQRDALRSILDNEGFKHIAAAIRRATVSEQFRKARTGQQVYEIHYGLFQDFERKARFKTQFVAALTSFITDYNTENARMAERRARPSTDGAANDGSEHRRPQITTDDVREVMTLIDMHDSELVAMLLLAYGSARESREPTMAPDETATDPAVTSESK